MRRKTIWTPTWIMLQTLCLTLSWYFRSHQKREFRATDGWVKWMWFRAVPFVNLLVKGKKLRRPKTRRTGISVLVRSIISFAPRFNGRSDTPAKASSRKNLWNCQLYHRSEPVKPLAGVNYLICIDIVAFCRRKMPHNRMRKVTFRTEKLVGHDRAIAECQCSFWLPLLWFELERIGCATKAHQVLTCFDNFFIL